MAYKVEAVLSAIDSGFTSTFKGAMSLMDRMDRQTKTTTSLFDKAFGNAGGFVKANVVMSAVSKTFGILSNSIGGATSRFDTMNRFPKMMNAWGYSTEDSTKSINALSKGIDGLPTKLDDIVESTQGLTMVNGDLEKSTKLSIALNNAFLASGSGAMDASRGLRQYTQMMTKGVVDMQSWRTLQETMPVGLKATAEAFGFTGASAQNDLYDALLKGDIVFSEFGDKLIELNEGVGGFAEMAKINSVGIATSWTNIQTAFSRGMEKVIRAVNDSMVKAGLGSIVENLEKVKAGVSSAFTAIIPTIENLVGNFKTLAPAVGAVAGSFMLLQGASPILDGVNRGVSLLNGATAGVGDKLKNMGVGFAETFKRIPGNIDTMITDMGRITNKVPKIFQDTTGALVDQVQTGYLKVLTATDDVTNKIPKPFKTAFDAVGKTMGAGMDAGVGLLNNSLNAMKALVQASLMVIGPGAIAGLALAGLGLLYSQFGGQIDELINIATIKGPGIIKGLIDGITAMLPNLINQGATMVVGLADVITANVPVIIQGGVNLIGGLIAGVGQNTGRLMASAGNVVTTLIVALLNALPQLIFIGMDFISSLISGFTSNIGLIVGNTEKIITTITGNLQKGLPVFIEKGIQILMSLINGIVTMIPLLIPIGVQMINSLITTIGANIPAILQGGINVVMALVSGIITNLPAIAQGAISIIQTLLSAIVENLPAILGAGLSLIASLAIGIITNLPTILQAGWDIISSLVSGILGAIPELFGKVWSTVTGFFGNLWDKITGKSKEGADNVNLTFDTMGTKATASTSIMATNSINNANLMSEGINEKLSTLSINAQNSTSGLQKGVSADFSKLQSDAMAKITGMSTGVTTKFGEINSLSNIDVEAMVSSVTSKYGGLNNKVDRATSEMKGVVSSNMAGTTRAINTEINAMTNTTQTGLLGVGNQYAKFGTQTNADVKNLMNNVVSSTTSGTSAMINAYQSAFSRIMSLTQNSISVIMSIMRSSKGGMQNAGYNAGMGFYYGLQSTTGSIYSLASQIAYTVSARIRSALDIHSPSRVLEDDGSNSGKGFANGLLKSITWITKATDAMINPVKNLAVDSAISDINSNFGMSFGADYSADKPNQYAGEFTLNLGQRSFRAFVDDITRAQDSEIELQEVYS